MHLLQTPIRLIQDTHSSELLLHSLRSQVIQKCESFSLTVQNQCRQLLQIIDQALEQQDQLTWQTNWKDQRQSLQEQNRNLRRRLQQMTRSGGKIKKQNIEPVKEKIDLGETRGQQRWMNKFIDAFLRMVENTLTVQQKKIFDGLTRKQQVKLGWRIIKTYIKRTPLDQSGYD